VLGTALCENIYQGLAKGRWLSPGTPVSSTNKADRYYITEILLKVALNTITLYKNNRRMSLLLSARQLDIQLCFRIIDKQFVQVRYIYNLELSLQM